MKWTGVSVFVFSVWLGFSTAGFAQGTDEVLVLGQVVVTATRQEEEVLRIPAHITVITDEDIQRSGADNVGDLLRTEAGLSVTNTSGSSPAGIFIDARGFNNGGGNGSRLLVLMDGRRINLVDTSNPDWAVIPVESIERIEIIRGSSTALYGDNAMAGVINIITKRGATEPSLRLSTDYRFYDCWDERTGFDRIDFDCWDRKAALSGTEGSLSYYLYGSYESSDGFRENSDYQASNYVGHFGYKIGPFSTIRLRSSYLSNDRLLPGALTEDEIADVGRDGSVTPEDSGRTHHSQIDIGFDSYLSENQWIEITGGQTIRSQGSLITIPDAGFTDLDNDSRSTALTSKYRIRGQVAGRENSLILGIDLLKETVRAESFNNFPDPVFPFVETQVTDYERQSIGAYVHEEFSIDPSLILTLSGRMDWSEFEFSRTVTDHTFNTTTKSSDDRLFRVWSPKVGLTLITSPTTNLFATWSRSFRFPNRDELTGFFGFTPELDPERATTYEVGTQIRAGRILEATASVFLMELENEIIFIPPEIGEFSFGENQNVPEVEHKGIEVSAMLRHSETVRLKGNYTLTRTEIIEGPFEGATLPITPQHVGSATLNWGRTKGWMLSIAGRFVGERILANDLANVQEELPSYTVFNTRLQFSGDIFDIFVGVNNVLNKKYEEFGGVGGFPFGDRVGVFPSPERNGVAGITLRL